MCRGLANPLEVVRRGPARPAYRRCLSRRGAAAARRAASPNLGGLKECPLSQRFPPDGVPGSARTYSPILSLAWAGEAAREVALDRSRPVGRPADRVVPPGSRRSTAPPHCRGARRVGRFGASLVFLAGQVSDILIELAGRRACGVAKRVTQRAIRPQRAADLCPSAYI